MTDTTEHAAEAVTRYVRFWNCTPDEQRRAGGETFTDDVTYVAPVGVLTGVEALVDFTEQFVSNVGAYEFRARAQPDINHHHARLRWELRVGEMSFAEGTDILTLGEDGRVVSIATFLDHAPAARPDHEGRQDS